MTRISPTANAALLLLLAAGCTTDNGASRTLEAREAGALPDDEGPRPRPTSPGNTPTPSNPSGGTEAGVPDAGPPMAAVPDAASEPAEAGLTPAEQAERDFELLYAMRCPDQPADVMGPRQPSRPYTADALPPSTATRPQLTEVQAERYTISAAFMGGGVYNASYAGTGEVTPLGGAGLDAGVDAGLLDAGADAGFDAGFLVDPLGEREVSYASTGDWMPADEIEDVTKIIPGLVVDPSGNGTNTTIQRAISDAVVVAGCPRVFIKVLPGVYHEKVIVPAKTSAPPLTLYGMDSDASRVLIEFGDSAAGAEVDGTPLSVHYSATFSQSLPRGFQARNLTIRNDYVEGTYEGEDQAAVAVMNQGDQAEYDNVRILGHRNTLYVKSTAPNEVARAYFRNCYVEGDEDFVLGRGAAVFDQCEFHSVGDRVSTGAVTAPSTRVDNPQGILILNSEFSADAIVSDVYLGRQWFEGDDEDAVGKVIVRNSVLGGHIRSAEPWAPSERVTPAHPTPFEVVLYDSDDYYFPGAGIVPTEVFLAEFGNVGAGAAR